MTVFCEAPAVVAEACEAARMGISGAYAAHHHNLDQNRPTRVVTANIGNIRQRAIQPR